MSISQAYGEHGSSERGSHGDAYDSGYRHHSRDSKRGHERFDDRSAEKDEKYSLKEEDCAICMDTITNRHTLQICKHSFCGECIQDCFKKAKPACPICGELYGKLTGNQPLNGTMTERVNYVHSLPGYALDGTIEIWYYFPDGVQGVGIKLPVSYYN